MSLCASVQFAKASRATSLIMVTVEAASNAAPAACCCAICDCKSRSSCILASKSCLLASCKATCAGLCAPSELVPTVEAAIGVAEEEEEAVPWVEAAIDVAEEAVPWVEAAGGVIGVAQGVACGRRAFILAGISFGRMWLGGGMLGCWGMTAGGSGGKGTGGRSAIFVPLQRCGCPFETVSQVAIQASCLAHHLIGFNNTTHVFQEFRSNGP